MYPKPTLETSPLSQPVPDRSPGFSPAKPVRTPGNRRKPLPLIRLLHDALDTRGSDGHPGVISPIFRPSNSIPFRMTFFAHPDHLSPIESYSYKKTGRGWVPHPETSLRPNHHSLPSFSTASKHLAHTQTSPTQFVSYVYGQFPVHPGNARPALYRAGSPSSCFLDPDFRSHWQRKTSHLPAISFLPATYYPRFTTHYPPASDLRHNPAAQGRHPKPIPRAGRIQ